MSVLEQKRNAKEGIIRILKRRYPENFVHTLDDEPKIDYCKKYINVFPKGTINRDYDEGGITRYIEKLKNKKEQSPEK